MNRNATFVLSVMLLNLTFALPAGGALAQQKHQVSFKTSAANSKYTQQTTIDVGDMPGHQVRVFEIHRTYPNEAPVFNGLKLSEMWTRGITDFADGTGSSVNYSVYIMDNGDKLFTRTALNCAGRRIGKVHHDLGWVDYWRNRQASWHPGNHSHHWHSAACGWCE